MVHGGTLWTYGTLFFKITAKAFKDSCILLNAGMLNFFLPGSQLNPACFTVHVLYVHSYYAKACEWLSRYIPDLVLTRVVQLYSVSHGNKRPLLLLFLLLLISIFNQEEKIGRRMTEDSAAIGVDYAILTVVGTYM